MVFCRLESLRRADCLLGANSFRQRLRGLGPRDRRLGIAHAPFEIPVGEFSDAEFAAAVDRYAAAGFGAADDVAALKLATQRVPGLLFERLALM